MDDDAVPRIQPPEPPWWAAAPPESVAVPRNIGGEEDDADDAVPFRDDEPFGAQDDADGSDVSEPLPADEPDDLRDRAPWWVLRGEGIEGIALANRSRKRDHERRVGFFDIYDHFWGYVDDDPPESALPTVRAANLALDRRDLAQQRLSRPQPLALKLNVVVAAIATLVIVDGSATLRLAAFAACLIFGFWFAIMVSSFAISARMAAIGAAAAAVACVVASAVPTIHATRWYDVLVGLAFAAAALFVGAMWPLVLAWRVERNHWARPDVAMVAALLEFGDRVEFGPEHRRHAVAELDRAATRFELAWYRVNRTGVDVTDRQLRGWAGRIRAEARELQRSWAFGTPSTFALLMHTYKLILAIVNRYSLEEQEDTWVRHGSWRRPPTSTLARLWVRSKQSGRYVRQCLLAGFIAITALLLLADTVWSAVPRVCCTDR
ncbi:hypothetical protein [Micromonospora aurantiaca (nom. illeg.)]|uniref:hypothetical protein n=1 Tax=Micromonospora aurantiaca (nom. illeg.) TaxID=47850 RepID=UPI00165753FE|nr:hypothetical protein [Micromonospora aurantiaca]MBC9003864.1 hypothetical protein [Micromonospora aurantiaca]